MKAIAWTLLAVLPGLAAAPARARQPVTPEVAAAPPAGHRMEEITWAPDGSRFAYLRDGSVFVYDVGTRKSRQLVHTRVLERQAVAPPAPARFGWTNRRVRERTLQWFPGSRRLLVEVEGDLFACDLQPGHWKQLTATREREADPRLSPDGRFVSFRRARELWVLEVSSGKTKRLTRDATATRWNGELDWVYPEELDLGTAQWWSPDSRWLAYLQFDVGREMVYPHADLLGPRAVYEPQRYPQAGTPNADVRLGVVRARGGRTRWLERVSGATDLLARVVWLPDSRAVAVEKLNRVQNRLELEIVGLRRRRRRTVLREKDPYWINVSDDLTFFQHSPRLLWSSERSGYRHLYVYSLRGKLERRLTRGDWEVSRVVKLDEAAGRVFFLATKQSPLERQLYSVTLKGGGLRRLTRKTGTHSILMSPNSKYYLDSYSSLTRAPIRTLHDAGGAQLAVVERPARAVVEKYRLLPARIVTVKAPDGARLYARLIRPAKFHSGKKYPAVVMVYGGPHVQVVRNRWGGAGLDQALAQAGFVVWQLDNRGSWGRGHRWEAKIYRRFGRQELADQLTGIRRLIGMGFVDPARIGLYGWSYGGFMTLYALFHAPGVFRAGVAGAPVTNFRNYDTIYTERYLGLPQRNQQGYRLSAAIDAAGNLQSSLLLLHNLEDDNVLFQNTMQLADALERAGKPFRMVIYPQKTHGVTGEVKKQLYRTIVDFFERELRPAS